MYKRIKLISVLLIIVMLGLVVAGCGSNKGKEPAAEAPKTYKLKLIGALPISHHFTVGMQRFEKYAEEKSNGRLDVELYPANQLYADADHVKVMPKGAAEMAISVLDMWAGLVPAGPIFNMPTLYLDAEHKYRAAHGKPGEIINKQLQEKGNCRILGWLNYGTNDFILKEPANKMADFKGKKIRAYGQYNSYFLEALGCSPVFMGAGDVYMAIQKGTIEGALTGINSITSRKFYEVAKYVPKFHAEPTSLFILIANNDFYNSLPPDLQKIVTDGAKEMEDFCKEEGFKANEVSTQQCIEKGIEFIDVAEEEIARWREVALPHMMAKFKENCDPALADELLQAVEALK